MYVPHSIYCCVTDTDCLQGPSCQANVGGSGLITALKLFAVPLSLAPSAIPVIASLLSQKDDTFSEDCLTLNVWTKPQTGDSKKAVMLYIHGQSDIIQRIYSV